MFDEFEKPKEVLDKDEAFNLLQELERNTSEEIRRQRRHFRLIVKAGVVLQSANASELLEYKIKGVTGDISEGGCSVLFPIPVQVGDVYRLAFDRKVVELPLTFARCLRCRLVREDAYEAGFTFFTPISLPESLCASADRA
jgi:hypothetical protein